MSTSFNRTENTLYLWNVASFSYSNPLTRNDYGRYEVSFERQKQARGYDVIMHVEFGDTSDVRHVFGASQHYAWSIDEDVSLGEWKNYKMKWMCASEKEKIEFIESHLDKEFFRLDTLFDDLDPTIEEAIDTERTNRARLLRAQRTLSKKNLENIQLKLPLEYE